jgi:hypothetical protein
VEEDWIYGNSAKRKEVENTSKGKGRSKRPTKVEEKVVDNGGLYEEVIQSCFFIASIYGHSFSHF